MFARPGGKRLPRAIIASVVFLTCLFIAAFFSFSGIIRFGKIYAGKIRFTKTVGPDGKPGSPSTIFTSSARRIYAFIMVRAFEDTPLKIVWEHGRKTIFTREARFAEFLKRSTGRAFPIEASVFFYIERPPSGWGKGTYRVRLEAGKKIVQTAVFSISSYDETEESKVGKVAYEDDSTGIVFYYPDGWSLVEYSKKGITGSGVIANANSTYPPRFVVYKANLKDANAQFLNEVLKRDEQESRGVFVSFSAGEMDGAYRTFEWETSYKGRRLKLRSVQVFLKSPKGVAGINCHSAADEFDNNVIVFDSIIKTARYRR